MSTITPSERSYPLKMQARYRKGRSGSFAPTSIIGPKIAKKVSKKLLTF